MQKLNSGDVIISKESRDTDNLCSTLFGFDAPCSHLNRAVAAALGVWLKTKHIEECEDHHKTKKQLQECQDELRNLQEEHEKKARDNKQLQEKCANQSEELRQLNARATPARESDLWHRIQNAR